jgi:hypothetical protein
MGIGAGIFLLALGAVLTFAVNVTTSGFNVHTIGVILMVVGAIGLLLDLFLFAPRRRSTIVRDTTYPAATRTVVWDHEVL